MLHKCSKFYKYIEVEERIQILHIFFCKCQLYLICLNYVTKEDLFVFKSERPFCIEFDMYDGYFQNHVHKDDWGFLAVETPFKGIRVLTRSGQGLLNQEIEMAQLLTKVLGKEIEKGNVKIGPKPQICPALSPLGHIFSLTFLVFLQKIWKTIFRSILTCLHMIMMT